MAQAVSVLDGEVNRNWDLVDKRGQRHLLTLIHDCVTGARAAMLDYEEVPGSAGTTNLFNLVAGRVTIPFGIKETGESGSLGIVRKGLTGFSYTCELNGSLVLDSTSVVQNTEYEYGVSIPASVDIGTRVSGVTWYEVHSTRKADGQKTLVHRRFRDFNALHAQVESLMKGHHLRSSLPRFPEKKSKLWTNHGDMSFVEDRRRALEQYMKTLLQLPHASTLDSTRAFLGMLGNLREYSVPWEGKELGTTLRRASDVASAQSGGVGVASDANSPPVITSVRGSGKSPPGVCVGDRLLKVNGESTEFMSLEATWSLVKRASRPVMLHFLGPIIRMDTSLAPLPAAFLRRRNHEIPPENDSTADDGGPPLAAVLLGPKPRSRTASGASSAETSWSIPGVSHMRWPAWGRAQGGPGDPAGSDVGLRTPAGVNGQGRPSQAPDRPLGGRALSRGVVGPFGNGAGASGNLPEKSRLFGDADDDDRIARQPSSGAWRTDARMGAGAIARSSEASTGRAVRGGFRGTSDWMPVMTLGSGASMGAGTATGRSGLTPADGGSSGSVDRSTAPSRWPAGGDSTSQGYEEFHPSLGRRGPAWPPKRSSASGDDLAGMQEPDQGETRRHANSAFRAADAAMTARESHADRTSAVAPSAAAFTPCAKDGEAFGMAGEATSATNDDEDDEENPFA